MTVSNQDNLRSPVTREWTVSAGGQLNPQAFAAVTYIHRDVRNFIDSFKTFDLGQTDVIVDGNDFGFFDNTLLKNTDDRVRKYQALALQSRYALTRNFNVDLNYTYMSSSRATTRERPRISRRARRGSTASPRSWIPTATPRSGT